MRSRDWILAALALLVVMTFVQCNQQAVEFDETLYPGTWTGDWNNGTFASTGTAQFDVTLNSATSTLTIVVDVNGNAFGGADPGPVSIEGTYTDTELAVDQTTTEFGRVTATLSGDGTLSGTVYPTGFDSMTLSGTWTSTGLDLTYTIYDPPGTEFATGTASLIKQ